MSCTVPTLCKLPCTKCPIFIIYFIEENINSTSSETDEAKLNFVLITRSMPLHSTPLNSIK